MHNHQQLHAVPDAYETSLLDKTNDLLELADIPVQLLVHSQKRFNAHISAVPKQHDTQRISIYCLA